MSLPKTQTREERIQALAASVLSLGDGFYTVESESGDGWKYLCNPSANTCDCQDQRRKRAIHPSYRCKHLEAVALYLRAQPKTPPTIAKNLLSMKQHLVKVAQRQAQAQASLARLEEIPKGLSMIEA